MPIFKAKSIRKTRMLRCVIIDDEAHIRETLSHMLKRCCPQVEVLGEAEGVAEGIQLIKDQSPDLLLLDIHLIDGTAFDILDQFNNLDFHIIFITAYEKYAIKAFEFSAVDYILKPVNPQKLSEAIKRAENAVQQSYNIQLQTLKDQIKAKDAQSHKLILRNMENIYLLELKDIIHCESDGCYTLFDTTDEERIMVSTGLRVYDDLLSESGFFRAHRSHLVNMKHIKRFEKQEGGSLILTNGIKVPVSSTKRERLLELFEELATE
jgi:two-component system LytT family response regulator